MLAIFALPILLKSPLLLGFLTSDPAILWGRLNTSVPPAVVAGPTIDPNIAYTSHALGTLAARFVAAGASLWWNPYEGVGTPLAGEMQSAALFPPTWLLLLPHGQVLEHVLFQIIAGLSTFALLRRLHAGVAGATVAGMMFAFNGTFAWLANAVVNPICFLPLGLLGIERIATGSARRGGVTLSVAIAGSLYAGFPEVAYFNGLLIGIWAAHRFMVARAADRMFFTLRVAAFGVAGVLLAAPLLLAFVDYLKFAHLGEHADAGYAGDFIAPRYAISMLLPYFTGRFFTSHADFWADVGGYIGLTPAILALAGSMGQVHRGLRLTLGGWVLLCLAVTFGLWPVLQLFQLIPLAGSAMLYRYLTPSWLMAAAVLAGLAVDDIARGALRQMRLALIGGLAAVTLLYVGALASGVTPGGRLTAAMLAFQVGAIIAVTIAVLPRRLHVRTRVSTLVLAATFEAVALFAVPLSAYPRSVDHDLAAVRFLQRNLGVQRFVTLGPISGNYGSYYGIAQVNHNDLPVPMAWVRYAQARLDPAIDPITLDPPSTRRLLVNLSAYAAIGTKFVVTPRGVTLPGLREVHVDRVSRIYAVPATRPYIAADGCDLRLVSRTRIDSSCDRASTLTRLELWMPGWHAEVNGRGVDVRRGSGIFQTVPLPAGRSSVSLRFTPPGIWWSYSAALAGALILAGAIVVGNRRRHR